MKVKDRNSKYAGVFGNEVVTEFKSITSALIWCQNANQSGGFAVKVHKVVNGIVLPEPIKFN